MSILKQLEKQQLINPPEFVVSQCQYETMMGSVAYGVGTDMSDVDIYGFCIPQKEMVFPHLAGNIEGFGKQKKRFEQYQQHHIYNPSNQREYDLCIFNIVKYFSLLMDNNPNIIDSLFTPQSCVLHCTRVAELIRSKRKMFLSKKAWHTFKGYGYSQMNKAKNKVINSIIEFEKQFGLEQESINLNMVVDELIWREKKKSKKNKLLLELKSEELIQYKALLYQCKEPSKRKSLILKHGYDTKFCYQVVRLIDEAEQILLTGDVDIQKDRERLKQIRKGEWEFSDIESFFQEKEKYLEKAYETSKLQHSCDEEEVKKLLFECLESHFGSLDKCVSIPEKQLTALLKIKDIVDGVV